MTLENILKGAGKVIAVSALALALTGCKGKNNDLIDPITHNYAPEINSTAITEVYEGDNYEYQVEATDQDGDILSYQLIDSPSWLSVDSSTGLVSGTAPEVDANTTYPVTIAVSDGTNMASQNYTLLNRNIAVNNAPETTITADFGNGLTGLVTYTITGQEFDEGDYVQSIQTNVNDMGYQSTANPGMTPTFEMYGMGQIVQGENTLEAKAVDNYGLEDPTPATSSFVSPTEEDARTTIQAILDARQDKGEISNYYPDHTIYLSCPGNPESTPIVDDYLVIKKDGSTMIHINHIGYTDNYDTEIYNKECFDLNGKPNFYERNLPVSEIESRLNNFLDANLN